MQRIKFLTRLLTSFLLLSGATASAQDKPGMTAIDLINLPDLADPQLAPRGDALLYTLGEADWKENKRIHHIWLQPLPDGEAVQLTHGKRGESSPRWSPDGSLIAFVAARGDDDQEQIHLMRAAGGEAWALTELDTTPGSLRWSADGSAVYFLASLPESDAKQAAEELQDDVFQFENDWQHRHLWKASVAIGKPGTVTQVTSGPFTINAYTLSRDASHAVVHRAPSPLLDHLYDSEVYLLELGANTWRRLTDNDQPEGGGQLSPDGSLVLFTAAANERFEGYHDDNLFVVPASGGTARLLLEDMPWSVLDATWSADGDAILFSANTGVRSNLFEVELASEQLTRLTSGDHAMGDWSYVPELDAHLATASTITNPGDVWQLRDGEISRLTQVFDFVAGDYWLPEQEAINWPGADGESVEGVLYYPRDYQQGTPAPLIVQTHGGPRSSDKLGFPAARNFVPLATARGWLVLQPNYRGSTGYGDEFMRNMVGNYWDQSHLDVMAGVDHLIDNGIADGTRMVKMGWSAGGHMTNKIITHTDRFRAASSGAGASNWLSMYAQTDIRRHRGHWFGGAPWHENSPVDQYWAQSPLREAWKVTTPTLLLVGAEDARVPAAQSVEFHRALRANGVVTELYIAPREGHGWRELRHQLFKINAEMAWFEKHVFDRDYSREQAPEQEDHNAP